MRSFFPLNETLGSGDYGKGLYVRLQQLGLITALVGLAVEVAWAQRSSPGRADASATMSAPIAVEIAQPLGSDIDPGAIRAAIARELRRPVVAPDSVPPPPATLRILLDGLGRAVLDYQDVTGEQLTRTIGLPPDPARAVERLALLAGNLARDQAQEVERRYARGGVAPTEPPGPPSEPLPAEARRPTRTAVTTRASTTPAPSTTEASLNRPAPTPRPLAGEARYRGRLGLYLMVGAGSSVQGDLIVPVTVGLAARWRLVDVALEGIGGLWSSGFGGGDLAVMLHHTVGPVLLGGGLAGGLVAAAAGQNRVPVAVGRAFVRATLAVRSTLDLFAQLDLGYGRGLARNDNQEGLMLDLGIQLRLLQ
jgi:hypothetical protein